MKKFLGMILSLAMLASSLSFGSVSAFAAVSYEREDNNSYETANSLTLGQSITGSLKDNYDDDYFKFVLPSDGRVDIRLTNQMAECEDYYRLQVYQYAGSNRYDRLLSSDYIYCRDTDSFTLFPLGLPKGTYYVRVDGGSERHIPYTLTVSFTAADNWETEFNAEYETADLLTLGNIKYGTLVDNYDDDYFKFVLPSDGRVDILFTNQMAECEDYFRLQVYQYTGSNKYDMLLSSDYIYCRDTASFKLLPLGLPKGTYYVRVDGASEKNLTYGLTVNFTAADNWETEFNTDYETADPLALGKTRYGTLIDSYDNDCFRFTIDTADIYNIRLTHQKKANEDYCRFSLYRYAGENRYDRDYQSDYIYYRDGSEYATGAMILQPGTYYIVIDGSISDSLYSQYGITVNYGVGDASGVKVAKRTMTSLKLSWKKAQAASGYEIQKKSSGKWKAVTTVTGTSYTFKKLKAGAVYEMRIRAYRNTSTGKVYSSWKTVKSPTKPETVTIKAPTANSKHQIIAKWKAVTRGSGYQVQYAAKSTFKKVIASKYVSGKSKTSYTGRNFNKGKTYYIRVRAYKTVDGVRYYGAWSKVKKIKAK